MGQYYIPYVETAKGEKRIFHSHHYDNGMKMMEHSYVGNDFLEAVVDYLRENPKSKLYWFGDYTVSERCDLQGEVPYNSKTKKEIKSIAKFIKEEDKKTYDKGADRECISFNDRCVRKYYPYYVLNYDKKEFLEITSDYAMYNKIHPLSILTSTNDGSGGSFRNKKLQKEEGKWSGDVFSVVTDAALIPKDFKLYKHNDDFGFDCAEIDEKPLTIRQIQKVDEAYNNEYENAFYTFSSKPGMNVISEILSASGNRWKYENLDEVIASARKWAICDYIKEKTGIYPRSDEAVFDYYFSQMKKEKERSK